MAFIAPVTGLLLQHRRKLCISTRNTDVNRRRRAVRSSLQELVINEGGKVNESVVIEGTNVSVNRKVLKNTELATLPLSTVLMPQSGDGLGADTSLALELLKGRDMEWVQSFPSPNAAFLWSEDELRWIEGSPVYKRAIEVRDELISEWETHKQVLNCTSDEFLRAIAWIRIHGAPIGSGKIVIAPFASYASTAEKGNCLLQERGGFFGKKTVALIAWNNIAEGENVTITRGVPNEDAGNTLLESGSIRGRPSYSLSVTISKLDKFYEDKAMILENQELSPSEAFVLYDKESPPDEFVAFMRLMCLETSDAFLLEPIFSSKVWGFMELPVSRTNEETVCRFIIGACEDALDGYSEIEGECERAEMAKQLVNGEKEVLKYVRNWFERRIMQLDEMQYYQERRLDELDLLRPLDESEIIDGGGSGVRIGRAFDQGM